MTGGRCACGRADCHSPAKHPSPDSNPGCLTDQMATNGGGAMTSYFQLPVHSSSLMRRIRRGLQERIGRIYGGLECLGLTCLAMHRMLLRHEGPNDVSNLERWLARNVASQLCSCITTIR